MQSYSEYLPALDEWFIENVNPFFPKHREKILQILFKENELMETVKLVGTDALSSDEQEILRAAKIIRENFTAQNFYDSTDSFTPLQKQFEMMVAIANI